tara:strand:+ start:263 stop:508 length:246 start_codon:yes stop_codon:yes gene_type:complete
MAQFKAEIQGNRGSVSRLGHKTTGIQGHICGWETGIRVEGHYDEELGDIFLVYQTGGSNRKHRDVLLGKLVNDNFNSQENT